MDNIKNDKSYALKAIEDIDFVEEYIKDKSYTEFVNDNLLVDAIMFRLIQLGENIKNISEEFKNDNSNVLWHEILGFRNGIVHNYGKTDYKIVYEIVTKDLKMLKNVLNKLLK